MMKIRKVEVMDVLRARDARADRQRILLEKHGLPLISFTMNIAGEIKRDAWIERAFFEGCRRIEQQLAWHDVKAVERVQTVEFTGCEALWAAQAGPQALKAWMQAIEEADALGRLFDIDVIDASGAKLGRDKPRRCLICDEAAQACGRNRSHPARELYLRAVSIIREHFAAEEADFIAECAQRALLCEALCAPKPGLVDRLDSGAHADMDIFSFAASASTLREYFAQCARCGMGAGGLETLRFLGRQAEEKMLAATGGANTHKGAIFSLGILCFAAGKGGDLWENAAAAAEPALRELEALPAESAVTGGEQQYFAYGLTGVRGEAAAGFPSVRNIALPALNQALAEGRSLNDACLFALLKLMAHVQDSNILRRRGMQAQRRVQAEAQRLLEAGCTMDGLRQMNMQFIRENISPGGSADLLAAACFVYFYEGRKPDQ